VLGWLRQPGWHPRGLVLAARQAIGTVVSVQATGEVPPGSAVTVTTASLPNRHPHADTGQGSNNGGG
jgi:hypothetical protein